MSLRAKAFLALASAFSLVLGQNTISVQVGSFYTPNFIAARNGDVVEFVFTFGTHSVTQSTFDDPCTQTSGGFSSGLISGFAANDTFSSPTWSLTITNATEPIYFYCQAMIPAFHCSSGMVGAINAPADQFSSFSAAAKAMTSTPAQASTVVLNGIGASASARPTTVIDSSALLTATTPISTSTLSSSSSTLPSQTSVASVSKSSSNTGAIVGGVVGGIVAVGIIAIVVLLVLRRGKTQRRAPSSAHGPETRQRGGYETMNAKPFISPQGTGGTEGNTIVTGLMPSTPADQSGMGQLRHQGSIPGMGPPSIPGMQYSGQTHIGNFQDELNRNTSYTTSSALSSDPAYAEPPLSGQSFAPLISPGTPSSASDIYRASHPTTDVFFAAGSSNVPSQYPAPATSPSPLPFVGDRPPASNVDAKEIAKEVASLLAPQLQGTSGSAQGNSTPVLQNRPLPNPFPTKIYESEISQPRSPGPPQYQRYDQ